MLDLQGSITHLPFADHWLTCLFDMEAHPVVHVELWILHLTFDVTRLLCRAQKGDDVGSGWRSARCHVTPSLAPYT